MSSERPAGTLHRTLFTPLVLCIAILLAAGSLHAAIPASERNALLALYNATNGASWTNNTGWTGAAGTECSWFGITCDVGETTVRTISLGFNQLSGSIPPELGNLTNLQSLVLQGNQLNGSIPPELGNLTNLQDLWLSSTQLSGSIPPELGNLTNLEFLDLYSNQLSGSIPPELGNLTNLEFLLLDSNQLSGPIPPELGNLTNLQGLWLYSNQLSGSIPPELGNLSNLQRLELDGNQLSGSIPPELGNLTNLVSLWLDSNQLSGSIPPELGNLTNLFSLFLHSNQLGGSIPPELGNLTNLPSLWLSSNQLSGSIPPELGNLSNLQTLWLNSNQLSGSIPPELANLVNLTSLDLGKNQLSASIPPELGNLANLTSLDLDGNQLSGSIPPELGNLTNLVSLWLDGNQLSGSVPPELGNLTNLVSLLLSANQLSGSIPPELGNLTNLDSLWLHANQLSGSIPPELGNLTNLQRLWLYSNQLTGDLPSSFSNLTTISSLRLDYNGLSASNMSVKAWADARQPGWDQTQTVAPTGLAQTDSSTTSIRLSWTPISYTNDVGRYVVFRASNPAGPFNIDSNVQGKSASEAVVSGLSPSTTYFFHIRTVTDAHSDNQNQVTSEPSEVVSATTSSAAPTISGASPSSGPTAGGTSVVISGTGFVAGATVSFGGSAATNVIVTNQTSITATTPPGAAGSVNITVTNPDLQNATLTNGFTYTMSAPTVSSVSPSTGPTAGGTAVSITGTGFVAGASVTFGSASAGSVNVVSATQITATTPANPSGPVTVTVTNPDSGNGSLPNAFTYCDAASITGEPQDASSTDGVVTLTVSANGTVPLSYQWYRGTTGNTASPISGATAASLQTPALADGVESATYWVRVTNSCGTDDSRTVTVSRSCVGASITGDPQDASSTDGVVTLTVSANGTAPLSYQWYAGSTGNTGSPLPGATSSNFTTPAFASSVDSATYWVRVTNSCGSDDSRTVTVTRSCSAPSISQEPQDASSATGVATLTVSADGTAPLTYQWYRGTSSDTASPIGGATGPSFQTPALADGVESATYWVRVGNACGSDNSRTATVSRGCIAPTITGEPQDASSANGQIILSVSAGGSAPLTYQWYSGFTGETSTPLPGATSSSFQTPGFPPGTDVARYWVRVSNGCGDDDSRTVTVTRACSAPSITNQPQSAASSDGRVTLGVTAEGTAPLSFQWYRGNSGNLSEPINGATAASFQTPLFNPGQTSASYWVRVSNACGQIDSATATITQSCVAARITVEPRDAAALSGIVTLSVTATGTAPLQYQWYRGASGDLSNPVGGATASSFLTPAFQSGESTARYWVRVTNSCGQNDSRTVVVSLEDPCASIPLSGAGFSFRGETSGCAPNALSCVAGEEIRFTSELLFNGPASCLDSVNARSTYHWSFGDGTGSSERNPSKSFAGPGPYFVTLSVTHPSGQRQATRLIEFAPRVVITEFPEAIVGPTSGGDTTVYTVRNIGGSQTTVNLTRQGTFFAQSPESFDLAPGASQRITITTLPVSQGRHDGRSVVSGAGVQPGTSVGVIFLAENAPIGDVIGVAVNSRVDVSSPVGASSVDDTATFTNTGSATLRGVASSDVAWLTPSPEVITIEPGREVDVPFTIDPTLRPDGGDAGTFNARLTLVYRLGTEQSGGPGTPLAGDKSGSTSAVVSHTATAATPAGQVLPLAEGEVAIFLPGVAHVQGSVGTFISDVTLTSLLKAVKIEGLRLHFRPSGSPVFRSLPSFDLSPDSSRTYADIARTIFENTTAVGSLQLRGNGAGSVVASASVFNSSNPAGTYGTTIPAFRSDRSAGANEKIFLTGLTSSETTHTNLYVQEATGLPASATIQFLNEQGVALDSREESLAGFGLLPLNSSVPPGGVSAVITTRGDSTGRLLAYATPVDRRSGDTWAIADWPRQYGYQATGPVLIPVAGALRGANDTYFRTDVAIMNSGESSGSGMMRFHSRTGSVIERTIELQASQSRIINDVLVNLFGISGDDAGYITFTPASGTFVLTSRTYTTVAGEPATFGSGVPTLALDSGIRLGGETKRMGGINDAAASTVSARRPNTFRTNLILVETAGEPVTVRATLRFISGNQKIVGQAIRSASFSLGARQYLQINQISHAILGDLRKSLGDLSNMQLELEVVEGNGAVVVLTSTLDNGTGDSILRVD